MRPMTLPLAALVACALARSAGAQEIPAPRLGGYVQARSTAQEHVGLTTILNRARLSADGALPSRFSYRFLIEFEAAAGAKLPATVSLREAMIRWSQSGFAFTAGQFKVPFSREYLIPVPQLETADFAAVVDSIAPKYDIGLSAEYVFGPWGGVTLGVFNGEGQNATANRDSMVMAVARVVARPIPQLTLGGNATRDGQDSLRWGVEGNLEDYGAMVRAEYMTRHRRERSHDQDDFGWYVLGGYRVIPRAQLIGRVEDFQRPVYGLARRVRANTLGINLELAPNRVRLLLEGVRRWTGAKSVRADQLIAQLQARF